MGSTGSGNFSDYAGVRGNNGNSGGNSGEDKCGKAFEVVLEDVERSTYFTKHGNVPVIGTHVTVSFNKRLFAIIDDGTELGYLPTQFNYIKTCLDDNFMYTGIVVKALIKPFATISITFAPNENN